MKYYIRGINLIKQSMVKNTARMRYRFVSLVIKHITPALYRKINLMAFTHDRLLNSTSNAVSAIPRPSIKVMKDEFKGRLVKGAEIGVQLGLNSESIIKELNIKELYLIDIWEQTDKYYKTVLRKFRKDTRVKIIKDFSKNAVKYIDDNSLDFVYIDANHEYNQVYQDIELWTQKVREKGIIAGHDVFNCSDVLEAVKDFCSKNKIIFHIKLPDWYFIKINSRDCITNEKYRR